MKKVIYIDTETTGLDHKVNDIVQLAYIVEIDGEIKERGDILIQPVDYNAISPEALKIQGRTLEMLKGHLEPKVAFDKFVTLLEKYINKFDRTDKFYICGYNVGFDLEFLKSFFTKMGCPYFGSYFNYKTLDVYSIVKILEYLGEIKTKDLKLVTVCDAYSIELNAHDAQSDINATRFLFKMLVNTIRGNCEN
jgi:DNA polymerase-3 subunit epsilon